PLSEKEEEVIKKKKAEPVRSAALPQRKEKSDLDIGKIVLRGVYSLLRITFFAALLAVIILIFTKPKNVPSPLDEVPETVSSTRQQILTYADGEFPRAVIASIPLTQGLLNEEFKLTAVDSPFAFIQAKPQRLYLYPTNGQVTLGLEMSLLGFPVYVSSDYTSDKGKVHFIRTKLGRLVLPQALLAYWDWTQPLVESGSPLLSALQKCSYIGFSPEEITLRWRGLKVPLENSAPTN
ncbi:MAG: hypothetical protein ACK5LK_08555, partial [Chthoniobacterales bacterium]